MPKLAAFSSKVLDHIQPTYDVVEHILLRPEHGGCRLARGTLGAVGTGCASGGMLRRSFRRVKGCIGQRVGV